ncbi:uncharacterized protein SCDLUD_000725 [Saccharomycodes ludwigii]|uniref:uncharacterized protein n=1 Tax=Saccharomycodes ludwigii TaxID=36035 RepID=UPI001E8C60C3|nr:hypothetical protein SCDLUD_000725 [Saccharomycodes ludwigii]KAH3903113.1 hypothetical protein SCDLUD_000725 [Saccharomycodes ludwigii]
MIHSNLLISTLLLSSTFAGISSAAALSAVDFNEKNYEKKEFVSDDYHNVQKHKHAKEAGKQIEGKEITHLFKREGTCSFPNYDGMVAVQTSGKNAGWAMHSDQQCTYGSWCPYACEPGQLMGQWDPEVTSYTYPQSQWGGLYCDESGNLQKKNSDKDYCYEGKGTVSVLNEAGSNVAFCQTVLPGNEEMLIPTNVESGSSQVLAVPGTDYWASTASHFYINPPGVSVDDGCVWGSTANPWGNWAPYVAGANMDNSENTYVKIGWNPVYFEDSSPFKNTKPTFGIRITCDDESKCNGLPCSIDPTKQDLNTVSSGGSFCVVTAEQGSAAKIEVFAVGGNTKREQEHHAHKDYLTETEYKTVTVIG